MEFEVVILGSNSAISINGRHPTSQAVLHNNQVFLIDCGEGTQNRLIENQIKWFKINHIFISHLHGDHYFGLIGLLTTFHLLKRSERLIIFAPKMLEQIIQIQLQAGNTKLCFDLEFVFTDDTQKQLLLDLNSIKVYSFPLIHKIPTTGFLFEEKQHKRKLNIDALSKYDINNKKYKLIQEGLDIEDEYGNVIKNEVLTSAPKPPRKYAFCSDTLYNESLIKHISNVDLLYHEATFMEDALNRATETKHSTAKQAAAIAKQAKTKKLIIGHFSSRYVDLQPLLEEAKSVFPTTSLAEERCRFTIPYAN